MKKTFLIILLIVVAFGNCKNERKYKIPLNSYKISINKNFMYDDIYGDTTKLNIDGTWRLTCKNYLTEFDIDKDEGYFYLYSFNSIYINVEIIKNKKNEFYMKFKGTASQKIYYYDMKILNVEDISKSESIGKITLFKNKLILDWYGLYNKKTKTREFVNDAVFIIENEGKNPVVFKKCKN